MVTVPEVLVSQASASFETFYRHEYRRALGLAVALTKSSDFAEDIVQDAFVDAHRQWGRISTYDDAGAWLRRVVTNRATSRWRRLLVERRALTLLASRQLPKASNDDPDAVWALVRGLPRRQAQTLALVYVDDMRITDVARVLGVSEATAKTHLQRARRTLAKRLEERDG